MGLNATRFKAFMGPAEGTTMRRPLRRTLVLYLFTQQPAIIGIWHFTPINNRQHLTAVTLSLQKTAHHYSLYL